MKGFLFLSLILMAGFAQSSGSDIAQLVEAAKAGNPEAMYAVFVAIAKKDTPDKPISDKEEKLAAYWLIKAGEHQNQRAAAVLALCYAKGCFGLPIDPSKASYYQHISKTGAP